LRDDGLPDQRNPCKIAPASNAAPRYDPHQQGRSISDRIRAIYEMGVFRPIDDPIRLADGETVDLRVQSAPTIEQPTAQTRSLTDGEQFFAQLQRVWDAQPVDADTDDASVNHDVYLYGADQ
jgi:predicted DNA-binding antitoxin AbrB/MazE fold protein